MRRANGQVFQWYRANVHSEIAHFQRSLGRMEALMRSGRFWGLAEKTRDAMRRMLALLYRRLSELERRAVMRFAGLLLALGFVLSPLGAEQITFVEQTGSANPFPTELDLEEQAALVFADVDGDGDQDAVVATAYWGDSRYYGQLRLFRRSGGTLTEAEPPHPFSALPTDLELASPAVADLDGDGDLDVFVGGSYVEVIGETEYPRALFQYRRNGPDDYTLVVGAANPLYDLFPAGQGTYFPAFADINGDGDTDLFVNQSDRSGNYLSFFENTGDATSPDFEGGTLPNPFDGFSFGGEPPALAFVDIDNDGDLDAFVGQSESGPEAASIAFLENIGDRASPEFVERTGTDNPLGVFTGDPINWWPAPTFVDFDEDGDMDAFVAGQEYYYYEPSYYGYGRIQYFKNTTLVTVTAAAQSATDAAGQSVLVASNKFAGTVYIVLDGVQATLSQLETAVGQHKAAKAAVAAANTDVAVSTAGLVPGTYYAYAASGGASPELSAKGTSAITVTASVVPTVTYPESRGLDSADVWIGKVTIGDLVYPSGTDQGYGDFTDQSATLTRGASVDIELVPGYKSGARYYIRRLAQQIWRVWVDWNGDGDFDDSGEEAYAGGPSQRALSATIQVPADALVGSTRIRVSMKYAGDGAPVANETFDYGEVEDYTAVIGD